MAAAFDVDVAAAEEDVDSLADAIEQIVGGGFDGAYAVEFGADEEGAFLTHEVTLALLLGAAGNGGALLQEVKAGGAGVLGHPKDPRVPKYPRGSTCSSAKVKPNQESS